MTGCTAGPDRRNDLVVWGVIVHARFIPEIASRFFTMGVVIGLIGIIFRLNGMTINVMASSFTEGEDDDRARLGTVGFAKAFCCWSATARAGNPTCSIRCLTVSRMASAGLIMLSPHGFMLLFRAVFNFLLSRPDGSGGVNHTVHWRRSAIWSAR